MTGGRPTRRAVLAGAMALAPTLAWGRQRQASTGDAAGPPPIVFVHGNGDSAAVWINNFWRFESNGFRRNQLFAIDFPYPLARTDNSKPQALRSSAEDQTRELAAFVAQVRSTTRRRKVALIASSRGGDAVRGYLKNSGGAEFVSHAVLCGTPNKGIVISETMLPGSEFNGAAPFLKDLNSGANDLVPGVEMMAIRSDNNDKYSQPDGRYVGFPGKPTGVGYDASELRGAKNVILDGLDHRETAFHKLAFGAQYEFIVGQPAGTLFIAQEPLPTLNGKVSGIAEGVYTNLPVADADVEIYEVDAKTGERKSNVPVHHKKTGVDGQWGPFVAHSDAYYEFMVKVSGQPTTHIYRSPFLRSSDIVHLRPQPFGKGDEAAGAIVIMSRPRGYFGVGRDKFSLDGKVPPGITEGVPAVSTGKLAFDATPRTVVAVFNNEVIPTRTLPAKDNHIVVAEFTN
ncbi:Lipase (class 2) [Enhydrobacter aerosaccus]|uniref:Lipase (Class 2) n=1 Tax=Enhydrobacter aerosaccus TaxID=225324 RepID=A0A1T4QTN9_9HYPH|nr:alpha/beta fold hydrolase [Enhydrobacter aerosaccus]SKA07036.1 Lipase (class 2) [Enhydrobacter aerosaccus]